MSLPGLTREMQRAHDAVLAYLATQGRMPSRRELAAALGQKSQSGAQRLIESLVARGYLTRLPRKAFAIALTDAAEVGRIALPLPLAAKLEAYCRLRGDKPADVIADAVALFLDAEEGEVAA